MQRKSGKQKAKDRSVVAAAPRQPKGLSSPLIHQSAERGSTLIISMIILVILMLLGVTAMNTSGMQYKLAGNLQFADMAMNNSEAAVNAAEQWLEVNAAAVPSASAVAALPDPLTMNWAANSVSVSGDTQRYMIGYVSTNPSPLAGMGLDCSDPSNEHNFDCVHTYLVTARGTGGRGAAKVVQTYYAVPLR